MTIDGFCGILYGVTKNAKEYIMKKLLIICSLVALCLGMAACDMDAEPTTTDAADEVTTVLEETTSEETTSEETTSEETTSEETTSDETAATTDETTAATAETVPSPEEILGEVKNPDNFKNVTIVMAGTVDGDAFNYTMKFADGNCNMGENGVLDELYEGEDADMVRSIFIDTALALLNHADQFTATENGFRYDGEISYEVEIMGYGRATIVATNNVVTMNANGDMDTLSCHMVQTSGEDTVIVDVTFTYSDYGTTVISAAE